MIICSTLLLWYFFNLSFYTNRALWGMYECSRQRMYGCQTWTLARVPHKGNDILPLNHPTKRSVKQRHCYPTHSICDYHNSCTKQTHYHQDPVCRSEETERNGHVVIFPCFVRREELTTCLEKHKTTRRTSSRSDSWKTHSVWFNDLS